MKGEATRFHNYVILLVNRGEISYFSRHATASVMVKVEVMAISPRLEYAISDFWFVTNLGFWTRASFNWSD